jgi:replicative DNA helicase
VHVFSLEMTAEDLATINLASTTRWTSDQIRAGEIDDWHDFMSAGRELGGLPVVVDDRAEMDITGLFLRGRAIRRRKKTRLVCIDYRELIRRVRDQARMSLPEWIPFLGYRLKALAKTLNCPGIALAQINKQRSADGPVRPTLDDLPYDGGQAADGVFALHRPELYMTAPPKAPAITSDSKLADIKSAWKRERDAVRGVAEFLALKRRFGPANAWRKLRFDGPRMLVSDWHEVELPPDRWGDDTNGGVF